MLNPLDTLDTLDTASAAVSLSAVDQYRREVARLVPLAPGEEDRLLACLAAGGVSAQSARARLIEGYQPLAIRLARGYASRSKRLAFLDFVQEGNVGLLEALMRHDGRAGGIPFRSWAASWMRGRMADAYWRAEGLIRLPIKKARALRRLCATRQMLLGQLGREATPDELAAASGLSLRAVLDLLCLDARVILSLHRVPVGDARGGVCEERLAVPPDVPVDEESEGGGDFAALLRRAVGRLPARERLVVSLRYGFTDGTSHSLQEVAQLLGLGLAAVADADRRARLTLRRVVEHHRAMGGALVA